MISSRGWWGRESGGKIVNDFLNDFPPAGEAGAKAYCYNNNNNNRGLYLLFYYY
jgi:hypothetical protein